MPPRTLLAIVLPLVSALTVACGDDASDPPAEAPAQVASLEPQAAAESAAAQPTTEDEPAPIAGSAVVFDELERVLRAHGGSLGADLEPVRIRTTTSVNLRTGPGGEHSLVRPLPEGTVGVAFYGDVSGQASASGGRGVWTYVVVNDTEAGWTSARFVEPDVGCIPKAESFSPEPLALVARARLAEGGRGLLTVRASEAPLATHIDAWELDEECVATHMSRTTLAGILVELRALDAPGESGADWEAAGRFMVTWRTTAQHVDRARTEWTAIAAGREEPLWHESLFTDASVSASRRDRVVLRSEDASGPCSFSVDYRDADANTHGAGGEYCFGFHSRRKAFVLMW